jgi:hypothetical protein
MRMNIEQAVRRLRSGDKVRRASWENKERHLDPDDPDDTGPILTYEDLLADDWETYDG